MAARCRPPPLSCRRLPAGASAAAGTRAQWPVAAALAAGRLDAPLLARSITGSAAALADINVAVPSMGESITEGTVAVILKQPGGRTPAAKPRQLCAAAEPMYAWLLHARVAGSSTPAPGCRWRAEAAPDAGDGSPHHQAHVCKVVPRPAHASVAAP